MLNKILKRLRGGYSGVSFAEQPASFYDEVYSDSVEFKKPFWQSRYYFLWTVIVDRLRQKNAKRILELGCGPGQFAELLYRDLSVNFVGVDFSSTAIALAQAKKLGDFTFLVDDVLTSPVLSGDYDSIVCTEVLEHIEQDLALLERIRPGTRCLLTVPNFPYTSHVRHFESVTEVMDRYASYFVNASVWGIAGSHRDGVEYFLIDGRRSTG